jgi:hypothetical protein
MTRGRIVYLTTWQHQYTVKRWFDPPPGPDDPELLPVAYEQIDMLSESLPTATYVFTDMDRLDGTTMRAATALAARVAAAGHPVANWPNRAMSRVELLTTLRLRGINDFACRRLTRGGTTMRFPVFLRIDGTHEGPATPLLNDGAAIRRGVNELLAGGARRDDILVVEYQNTDRVDGNFVKYSAYYAFGQVLPANVILTSDWTAKSQYRVYSEAIQAFEMTWAKTNPQAEAVATIFRHAGIDWGRIDYGLHQGRIQVFEINTNPDLGSPQAWSIPERRDRFVIPVQLANVRASFRRLAAPPAATSTGKPPGAAVAA